MDVELPEGAWAGAVLLHPHPDYGGDRHNVVVSAPYRALPAAGIGAVRFDFRSADVDDGARLAVAALDALPADVPAFVVGYSFGAVVALRVVDQRVAGRALVAPSTAAVEVTPSDPRPTLVLYAEHDQYFPPSSPNIEVIPGADHFLAGATERVAARVVEWIRQVVPAA